jgi:hypothetical protein
MWHVWADLCSPTSRFPCTQGTDSKDLMEFNTRSPDIWRMRHMSQVQQLHLYVCKQAHLCTAALAADAAQQLPPLLLDHLDAVDRLHPAHIAHRDLRGAGRRSLGPHLDTADLIQEKLLCTAEMC